jgi:hypothetical protein
MLALVSPSCLPAFPSGFCLLCVLCASVVKRLENHEITALRYLLSWIDARGLRVPKPEDLEKPKPKKRPWLHWTNDALYGPP